MMTASETLQHAKARFECLAEEFDKAGDSASWAMCSTDAEMMGRTIAALSDQVVVPRKITIPMIAAGWAAFRRDKPPVQLFGPGKAFVEAWDAMIAAAPPPSSTAGEG